MHHHAAIGEILVESKSDFIVFGPSLGLVSECGNLTEAKSALRKKLSERNGCNAFSDLSIFHWSADKWRPALSLYELQEWELQRNPSRIRRFP